VLALRVGDRELEQSLRLDVEQQVVAYAARLDLRRGEPFEDAVARQHQAAREMTLLPQSEATLGIGQRLFLEQGEAAFTWSRPQRVRLAAREAHRALTVLVKTEGDAVCALTAEARAHQRSGHWLVVRIDHSPGERRGALEHHVLEILGLAFTQRGLAYGHLRAHAVREAHRLAPFGAGRVIHDPHAARTIDQSVHLVATVAIRGGGRVPRIGERLTSLVAC